MSSSNGVVVVYVDPKGISGKIGIRSGDVIRQINQSNIKNEKDFNKAIIEAGKLSSILLLVQRGTDGYYVTLEPWLITLKLVADIIFYTLLINLN